MLSINCTAVLIKKYEIYTQAFIVDPNEYMFTKVRKTAMNQ
jgi:hypothetical protein